MYALVLDPMGALDMSVRPPLDRRRVVPAILLALATAVTFGSAVASDDQDAGTWFPRSDYTGKWDWVQMTSGEWLKGEIIAMYEDSLEFESDEFDTQFLDWSDIRYLRSVRVINVGLVDRSSVTGTLIVDGDEVTVRGAETRTFPRDWVLTMIAGEPREINFWTAKLFFGWLIRTGNSDVREVNVQASVKRRSVRDRTLIDFVANQNVTDGVDVADNARASASWDRFVNDRFFVRPVFGEYFRDRFQNISARLTVGVGAGYQIVDTKNVDWSFFAGPAYQETRFVEIEPGEPDTESTPAFVLGTTAEWDITRWLEFDGTYRAQFVNERSGTYNHHLVASLETDITSLIDLDVSWIWDRIEDPRPAADGTAPVQDDFRTTVGLTFEF
jgi:putative salt-induced outer membrane protein YdiY